MKKRLSQIETVYKSKLIETGDGGMGDKASTTETIPKRERIKREEEEVKVKNDKTSL